VAAEIENIVGTSQFNRNSHNIVKVKVTLRRMVSQSVCLGIKPRSDVPSCMKVTVLSGWGTLPDEGLGLSFVRQSVVLSPLSVCILIYTLALNIYSYVKYIQSVLSVQAQYNRPCPICSSNHGIHYQGSLVT
jgi:hypothetical protein